MLDNYCSMLAERKAMSIEPKTISKTDLVELTSILQKTDLDTDTQSSLFDIFAHRVPPGVDETSKVKADFLFQLATGELTSPIIQPQDAVHLLGTMQGGYNVVHLVNLLEHKTLADTVVAALEKTILVFDNLNTIHQLAINGNLHAEKALNQWAEANWFHSRREIAEKITVTVFKVPGEINTDDLSPAQDAWSRPDIPLHAQAMLKVPREGMIEKPLDAIAELKQKGYPVAFVGDVVGTGSSRKSAANSVIWHIGNDIPFVPNKRFGGVVIGGTIAPIFYNTLEDAGALPIESDVSSLSSGQVIDIYPYKGEIRDHETGQIVSKFSVKSDMLFDSIRAGGRIQLILGRQLTDDARELLNLPQSDAFRCPETIEGNGSYSLAQKIVGKACGLDGVYPGQYCQPKVATVGSQDTTGPMTRDEVKDLACLNFNADLVLQTFCHTAPYPRPIDAENHSTMPPFFESRGGVAINPGDGVIHSWLNRMILPDTVGTGGDSHTRFPLGVSFPAGSGLVAFAAATGMMPLDMPESVLVRFKGEMRDGITLRDLVHAIPYFAIKKGLLTVEKANKKNIFAGKIIEIEGLETLSVEQAFELADATAERSASGCSIALDESTVSTYLNSNITLLEWMISQGYESRETIQKRIDDMKAWLADPKLLKADPDAQYAEVLEIDVADIIEPLLCCPNDPDDVKPLSEVKGTSIDEVFIGSCMTNIGHFRAAGQLLDQSNQPTKSKMWIAPPTKMDEAKLRQEGLYNTFARKGVRLEMPGCSLCMGNQAQIAQGSTAISTSTRNFPNRLGKDTLVYLGSAELATITAMHGQLPTVDEYMSFASTLTDNKKSIYSYLDFSEMEEYQSPDTLVVRQI
ncbi:bifunctional aconitate hydratase 2/2-methylisocitrate dehydratase [Vibrio sp. HN007]|uniref:bifunctional aconitate hydratase 2/2-methylisocitrate dehydratase n=1 Tax=Vibrio iocasae TaxID=3098914 RepID=UPI0035D42F66